MKFKETIEQRLKRSEPVCCLVMFLLLAISSGNSVNAETSVYSYINEDGKLVYTNTPSISLKEIESTEKKVERYQNVIENIASRFKVDPKLIHAIIIAESNYNPYAVSRKGAKGIMQLMPGTAQRYGVKRIFDPVDNIIGGVKYLKDLLIIFDGDLRYALAAYNAGENMVKSHNGIPPFKETRNYVKKVLALYDESGGKKVAYKYWDFKNRIHYSFDKPIDGTYKKLVIINLTE